MSETEDFGSYLKHERELRGVSLEDIADQTKIHLKYLEALENNLYDNLPGEVFVKGYIRSYAKSIGSDVEEIINAYDDSVGRERRANLENACAGPKKKKSTLRPLAGLALLGLILAGLAYGGTFLYKSWKERGPEPVATTPVKPAPPLVEAAPEPAPVEAVPGESDPAGEKKAAPETTAEAAVKPAVPKNETGDFSGIIGTPKAREAPVKEPANPAGEPASGTPGSKKASTGEEKEVIIQSVKLSANAEAKNPPATAAAEPETPLVLKIQARENAWFNLTVDDYREEDFILSGGREKSFSGKEKFRITIGNKNNTHLFLNGKPVVLPEVSGEVVRDFIINSSTLE